MAPARPRYGLVLACLVAASLSGLGAVTVTFWALVVLPFAVIVGVCAWRGLTLAETWAGMTAGSDEDLGRGPAGLDF